ncbi:branched-chain amino acid aminotransferase [Stappia aggregata IAM 12614]|uniref:Branched-chain amino acid aminotransferase n=1 Tax=Roseibium aggregatum (strain ATCC 25650 / DSM 13394 / JCM 20685 / NBRC 16684 / NCIMB 2208 / IAM 12614 / B1) TaxID=384765 RepID=A0NYI7_ROSAI|nr:hypothetical protein [Roseibium aggregatum]EAV42183.1 branched-chain amino acid aminotransferase [Stappia aggregata IAM 12614] [Roseibium aggregatum IAM 12614]
METIGKAGLGSPFLFVATWLRDLTLIGSIYERAPVFQGSGALDRGGRDPSRQRGNLSLARAAGRAEKFLEKSFVGKIEIDVGA